MSTKNFRQSKIPTENIDQLDNCGYEMCFSLAQYRPSRKKQDTGPDRSSYLRKGVFHTNFSATSKLSFPRKSYVGRGSCWALFLRRAAACVHVHVHVHVALVSHNSLQCCCCRVVRARNGASSASAPRSPRSLAWAILGYKITSECALLYAKYEVCRTVVPGMQ